MTATKQHPLPSFEDHDVDQCRVRLVNVGDGLSEALKVTPVALELGQVVHYVVRGTVTGIAHQQKDDGGPIVRVHTVRGAEMTEVDEQTAKQLLAVAAERTERRKAEIAGQLMLDAEQSAEAAERGQEPAEEPDGGEVDDAGHRVHVLHPNREGALAEAANPKATRRRP